MSVPGRPRRQTPGPRRGVAGTRLLPQRRGLRVLLPTAHACIPTHTCAHAARAAAAGSPQCACSPLRKARRLRRLRPRRALNGGRGPGLKRHRRRVTQVTRPRAGSLLPTFPRDGCPAPCRGWGTPLPPPPGAGCPSVRENLALSPFPPSVAGRPRPRSAPGRGGLAPRSPGVEGVCAVSRGGGRSWESGRGGMGPFWG